MARQGHRVWAARLVGYGTLIIAIASVSAYGLWQRFANESTIVALPSVGSNSKSLPENATPEVSHALDPLLDFAKAALRNHIEKHRDYIAVLIKRERVNGKLLPETKMALKLKYGVQIDPETSQRPVSVYLRTMEPKSQAGREVIWVQGRNNNKLTAHESGFLGIISVDLMPESRLAMLGNRYPITDIGIEKLLGKLIERGQRDRQLGPATVRTTENASIGDRTCRLIEVIHESPTATVDGQTVEFEFSLAQIYIDQERLIPLKYASFSWPKTPDAAPELLEEYTYLDISINVGLTEADFDTKNPAYGF